MNSITRRQFLEDSILAAAAATALKVEKSGKIRNFHELVWPLVATSKA